MCLTVDLQVYGRRERDLQQRYDPRVARASAPNPQPPDMNYQARLTWDDVAWLRSILSVPLGLKGIMTAEDARLAVEAGVQIVWVSNHGGRQLDHGQATIDVLPEIVEAVAGRAEIIIDGGFSRGTDVIKAVALGAKVVAMGRTVLWGLAVDGAAGVARTLRTPARGNSHDFGALRSDQHAWVDAGADPPRRVVPTIQRSLRKSSFVRPASRTIWPIGAAHK